MWLNKKTNQESSKGSFWTNGVAIVTLSLSLFTISCGGNSFRQDLNLPPNGDEPTNPGGGGDPIPDPHLLPPFYPEFGLTGPQGDVPVYRVLEGYEDAVRDIEPVPIYTDTLLRVTINPSLNVDLYGGDHSFAYNQSCVSFDITVNGQTRNTGIIKLPGGAYSSALCPTAPTKVTLDFSSAVQGSSPQDIRVKTAFNDWKCIAGFGYPFCPVAEAYWNHWITGNLCVQVDGTYACE